MPFPRISRAGSLLALHWSRSFLMRLRYRLLVGAIGLSYAIGAMLFSGMLYVPLHPLNIPLFFFIEPSGPGPAWNYPAVLAGGPYFQVDLPMMSTILMTLSAAGVGLGMGLAVLLAVRLLSYGRNGLRGPTLGRSALGLTPAMIALVTLGACCSTTAAATAGISLFSRSGDGAAFLGDTWYLGLVQLGIVYVALIAQEQLVRIYDLGTPFSTPKPTPVPARPSRSP